MTIIISPAKKMRREEYIESKGSPILLDKARELVEYLKSLSAGELEKVWRVKGKLLSSSLSLLSSLDLTMPGSPALFSYDGIQYTYMSPSSFSDDMLSYCQNKLRIISGLYGILRPLDSVLPYRLEMESPIDIGGRGDLYHFWGSDISREIEKEGSVVVNLASKEYSKAVLPHLSRNTKVITPVFLDEDNGKLISKGVYAKMERGEMVRFLSEMNVEDEEGIKAFSSRGYAFEPELSNESEYVFLRRG